LTDIEKALERADIIKNKNAIFGENIAFCSPKYIAVLADAYRAEKKRADEATLLRDRFIKASCNLGAENARLRGVLQDIVDVTPIEGNALWIQTVKMNAYTALAQSSATEAKKQNG
jgi:hypothetical protein